MAQREASTRSFGQATHPAPLRGGETREAARLPGLRGAASPADDLGSPASIPQVSVVTRLAGLARLLARQAARDLQRLAGAGLDLVDLDGQVNHPSQPDQPSAEVQCGSNAGATPRRANSRGLISRRHRRPNRGRG